MKRITEKKKLTKWQHLMTNLRVQLNESLHENKNIDMHNYA